MRAFLHNYGYAQSGAVAGCAVPAARLGRGVGWRRRLPLTHHSPPQTRTLRPAHLRTRLLHSGTGGFFFFSSNSVLCLAPESHGSASNWKVGYGSGSASKSDRSRSALVGRWQAKMYGIWAYLSTFLGFEPLFGRSKSGSALKWKVGSGSASRWQAGSGSASKWCGSAILPIIAQDSISDYSGAVLLWIPGSVALLVSGLDAISFSSRIRILPFHAKTLNC